MMECWMIGENQMDFENAVKLFKKKNHDSCISLESSYDLVLLKSHSSNYISNPPLVSRLLKTLIECLVVDLCFKKQKSLTMSMKFIQECLYNFLRMSLRYSPMLYCSYNGNSPFFDALDIWLLWLEPWNFETTKSFQKITVFKSNYNSTWERYVNENYHFY